MEKIKIILIALILIAPSLLISKDCGDEPIKPEKKKNQNQLAYALSSEYLIWVKDYEIWKNCKEKTQESSLDEKISSNENESNKKEADCGNKPIYTGSKFGTYRNSKEYKEFKKRLNEWESCNKSKKVELESELQKYYDENIVDPVEGIWIWSSNGTNYMKSGIKKTNTKYLFYFLEKYNWLAGKDRSGQIIGELESMASENVFMYKNLSDNSSGNCILKSEAMMECVINGYKSIGLKSYPKSNSKKLSGNGDWMGNGSGFIINKSGYIITNYHVIEKANEIEVEFIYDGEKQSFKAEILKFDKINDLAIIKIVDVNFDGLDDITYNFKTRTSDVGTKVFAYGYPYALSGMGKEIKVTDGIISSKTGFDGDITRYQISAPIQGGNSGGPLFDSNGNLIGINSAKIQSKNIDNVGYSIKTSYVLNLIDILPKNIELPSSSKVSKLALTEQVKEISKYVVLVKVK